MKKNAFGEGHIKMDRVEKMNKGLSLAREGPAGPGDTGSTARGPERYWGWTHSAGNHVDQRDVHFHAVITQRWWGPRSVHGPL